LAACWFARGYTWGAGAFAPQACIKYRNTQQTVLNYCPHMYFTVILGGDTERWPHDEGNADQPGRGRRDAQGSLSGRVHAVQQVWVGPLVLAGGLRPRWSSGGYGVQRRCDLRGLLQRAPTFRTVAGAGDILLGLEAPEAAERLVARLGSPRLTWRIGGEQGLPRRRYRRWAT
jgi:hypothetical protein